LSEARSHLAKCLVELQEIDANDKTFRHMCGSSIQWLQQQPRSDTTPHVSDPTPGPSLHEATDAAIDTFLVIVQKVRAWPGTLTLSADQDNSSEIPDAYVKQTSRNFRELQKLLSQDAASQSIQSCAHIFNSNTQDFSKHEDAIVRLRPFLDGYALLIRSFLLQNAEWTRATLKLTYVICNIVQTLASKGFCQPTDADTNAKVAEGKAEATTEGTGLGEGSGMEDVSKEIEDESQVEGLQGEEKESGEKGDSTQEKDALEMKDDFGGEMEDVEDEGTDNQGSDGSDDEDEPELDEKIANLDPLDPNAVDEKLWGDESKDPEKPPDEKIDEDRSMQDQGKESEMGSKEDKKQTKKETQKEKEPLDKGDEDDKSMDEGEGGDDDFPEQEEGGDEDPQDGGARMDDHVKNAETLDLPENLDLGAEEDGKDEDGTDDGMDEPEDDMDEEMPQDEREEEREKEHDFQGAPSPTNPENEGEDAEDATQNAEGVPDDTDAENPDADSAVAPPDATGGSGDNLGASSQGPRGSEEKQPQHAEPKATAVDDPEKTAKEQNDDRKPGARFVLILPSLWAKPVLILIF
jgi:midasin